eukprot:TRINITY_DN23595_c1_g2_i1.p1 TRINITY_DN23595_c1_g2~~TRINITY_DN23595_c1_g2_i1.p1  ORF type:complete len:358 (+),score=84.93 TRINITY_DN23595_c1_g2_i1:81-1154(+)
MCSSQVAGRLAVAGIAAAGALLLARVLRRRCGSALERPGSAPILTPAAAPSPRAEPRVPRPGAPRSNATTAVCITGAIRQGHRAAEAALLLATAKRFDVAPDMFAYVNPCDDPNPGYPGVPWYGNRSTGCGDMANSSFTAAVVPELRALRLYSSADVSPPPTQCPRAWPPKGVARYYSQHVGWRRCLELVQQEEHSRGRHYRWVVKLRADLAAHRDPDPQNNLAIIKTWVYDTAFPVDLLDEGSMYIPTPFGGRLPDPRRPLFINDWMFAVPRELADRAIGSLAQQYLRCDSEEQWEGAKQGVDWGALRSDGRWWHPNDLPAEMVLGKHLRDAGVKLQPLFMRRPARQNRHVSRIRR